MIGRTHKAARISILILAGVLVGSFSMTSADTDDRGLRLTSLENVEYLAILLNLTTHWSERGPHHPYAVSTRQGFLPFGNHKAVTLTRSFVRKRSTYDLLHLALLLTDPPELRLQGNSMGLARKAALRDYTSALQDFCQEADWSSFWARQQPKYVSWRRELESLLSPVDVVRHLEGYFGKSLDAYVLVFTPHLTQMRMSRILGSQGNKSGYVIFGPRGLSSDQTAIFNARNLAQKIVFREFGRLFALQGLEIHNKLLSENKHMLRFFSSENPQSVPWHIFFLRKFSSSLEIRLVQRAFGEAAAYDALAEYTSEGEAMVAMLNGILQEYEQARGRYPSLVEFLPTLFQRLNERMTQK